MRRNQIFITIFCFFLIISLSFESFAQNSCEQFLKECISDSEVKYKQCLDNKMLTDFKCESMGYKPYSKDFRMCVEDANNYWDKTCRNVYHQYTENCYKTQKKCRKGDMVGIVHMSFKEKSEICASAYIERHGSYTLVGIWRNQPSESYGFIQSFKPENPHIVYNYNETSVEHNENCPSLTKHTHDCPILLWHLQDGSARVYTLDPRYDGPAARVQIHNIPNMGAIYRAVLPGMVVSIEGKKRKGNSHPYCTQYENHSRQISIGSFAISDNILPNFEMKGSETWKSCGHPFQDKMGFGIGKDRLTSKSKRSEQRQYSPTKVDNCPSGEEVLINTSWKFYLIK